MSGRSILSNHKLVKYLFYIDIGHKKLPEFQYQHPQLCWGLTVAPRIHFLSRYFHAEHFSPLQQLQGKMFKNILLAPIQLQCICFTVDRSL